MATEGSEDYRTWQRLCREARDKGLPQAPMVGWYDPGRLMQTGINIIISTALGTRSDVRWMEAATGRREIIEYKAPEDEKEGFWFDYMADTGDGWDSTSRMAYLVGKPSIAFQRNNQTYPTNRGKFLILGGDEVYPCASKQAYKEKLVNPFCAMQDPPRTSNEPKPDQADLYAIPGNHDWYDGLVSFMRQFQQGRDISIWRTKQCRSYFALKLPCNWWLWGVDTQLEADIDWPQVQFFQYAARKMRDDEQNNLIVCTAEPYWIYANMYQDEEKKRQLYNNLSFLLGPKVLGTKPANLYLSLSGDLHHYRRHVDECNPNRHKIVAGGGGAFLHPTHDCELVQRILVSEIARVGEEDREAVRMSKAAERSSAKTNQLEHDQDLPVCSKVTDYKRLGRDKCGTSGPEDDRSEDRPLAPNRADDQTTEHIFRLEAQFPSEMESRRLSRWIPAFIGFNLQFGVVTALVYVIIAALMLDLTDKCGNLGPFVHRSWMGLAVIGAAHVAVYRYLCDERRGNTFRWLWGGGHGVIQFFAAYGVVCGWSMLAMSYGSLGKWACLLVGIPASGYLLGSTLLGVWFFLSLNIWKVNQNEAFSALRSTDYKNFLRMCIKPDGSLVIYPIGLRTLHEDAVLIEDPITIRPRKAKERSQTGTGSTAVQSE
ncbi:MAG: hypothetical protein HY913_12950 [Desulfomonile tiedjei]|nr:hypothetical protein [Desulfomonile tiedjei]